ncbi:unnamed protein product [Caretta caretta]
MEFTVECGKKVTPIDILRKKNELEEKGLMTEGLAACFSQAIDLVAQQDPRQYWLWENARIIIQGDGRWLEFRTGDASQHLLVWYDQHKKEVQVSSPS